MKARGTSAGGVIGLVAFCCGLGLFLTSCGAAEQVRKGTMQLTSGAFAEGARIPAKYTYDGSNISPPLKWTGVPASARSLALIADDPDAPVGTWVHWVLYDLPPALAELPEDVPKSQTTLHGGKQGLNDFQSFGYGGPSPPRGKPHRYFFKLYALDTMLDLKPGATKKEVERAMDKHIVGQAQLIGTYQRP